MLISPLGAHLSATFCHTGMILLDCHDPGWAQTTMGTLSDGHISRWPQLCLHAKSYVGLCRIIMYIRAHFSPDGRTQPDNFPSSIHLFITRISSNLTPSLNPTPCVAPELRPTLKMNIGTWVRDNVISTPQWKGTCENGVR